jgi:fructokinase
MSVDGRAGAIVVAGEALIDLILHPDGQLSAAPGGGPFNVARTIGRLGGDIAYLGRLSTDRFGGILRSVLETDGVDLGFVVTTEAPTTLAVAELDDRGAATYRFHLAETSAPGLELDEVILALRSGPRAVHLGTLGLVVEPIGSALAAGIGHIEPSTLVMVDPNCRPRVIHDRDAYLSRLRGILARADIVKVSADDLAYIAPDDAPGVAGPEILSWGPAVVLLTDGARPVRVIGRRYEFEVPVPEVVVADTVGSGDAFGGAFLARWIECGLGIDELTDPEAVRAATLVAVDVARLTCERRGAEPPQRAEVARLAG